MNFWYKFYFTLVDDHSLGIIGKVVNRVVAKFVKNKLERQLPIYYTKHPLDCGVNKTEHRDRKLVCSLTSFPARIEEVWKSIETVFRQSYKADEVVIWLATPQFPDHKLPESILRLQEKGLTVRWCDEDLRSHKKYYYVLQEYKEADIVLLDDDLYYPDRLLENLVKMAQENPGCICATRVHKMTYTHGKLNPYRQWVHNFNKKQKDTSDLFFTSGAGTLIPFGVMPEDTFNTKVFKDICFGADDVWLNFQARRAGIKVITNSFYNKDEICVGTTQQGKLVSQNVFEGGNDKQINAVNKYLKLEFDSE